MVVPKLLPLIFVAGCFDVSPVQERWRTGSHVEDWRDEVIYQLVVDRFANGDPNNDGPIDPNALGRYQGGDWQGVIDRLDYLEDLGVTAIWISPVVRNVDTDANVDGYHGYWAQDLTRTNPHFGDLGKLREMVQKAHARKIKVILDIVTNHLGQLFYYDINNNGVPDENVYGSGVQSKVERVTEYDPDWDPRGIQGHTSLGDSGPAPIRWIRIPSIHRMPPEPKEFQNPDWYNRKGRIVDYNVREQVLLGDFPGGLKDLKTTLPEVRRALIDVFAKWIDAADFDGFRIDTLKHVEHEFWQEFCPAIRRHCKEIGKKNFFMFGEAFDGDDKLVGSYTFNDQVDSAFFFPQLFAVINRVIKQGSEGTKSIEDQFNARRMYYGTTPHTDGLTGADGRPLTTQQLMVNFLDNHDIPRFLFDKVSAPPHQPWAALHNALAFLFTEDGIPCVYYGTEQAFRGGNDPQNRERLWDSGYDRSAITYRWIKTLAELRRRFRPLRRGDLQVRWSTTRKEMEEDAGIFAFERVDGDKRVLVVFNFHEQHASSTRFGSGRMMTGFAPGTALVNVLDDDDPADGVQVGGDGSVVVTVPARGQKVLVPAPESGGIP